MKIGIGCDSAGYEFKLEIIKVLKGKGHDIADVGCHSTDPSDYPDYAEIVGKRVVQGEFERGILICGTGQGMCIAANKVRGVRAALCFDVLPAIMSREHNNSNVLCLGAWLITPEKAIRVILSWLFGKYNGGPHETRIKKIYCIENSRY